MNCYNLSHYGTAREEPLMSSEVKISPDAMQEIFKFRAEAKARREAELKMLREAPPLMMGSPNTIFGDSPVKKQQEPS